MRAVIQRVSSASVTIDGIIEGKIDQGFMVLLGVATDDTIEDMRYIAKKVSALRVFSDEDDKMNLSLADIDGSILLISQFTLHASTKKGNRPSFITAAKPDVAIPLYEAMITTLRQDYNIEVATGIFGADMKVALVNDGPVTIIIDSTNPT